MERNPTTTKTQSYPNLTPSGSLTLEQSLRTWVIQWSLQASDLAVESALAKYVQLLQPGADQTIFKLILNQMIEERRGPSVCPDIDDERVHINCACSLQKGDCE